MAKLHVIGVRHHSPACARVVQAVLERVRPVVVLVEGPADFNRDLSQLALEHEPPVAIFTHYTTLDGPVACFTPFCAWSPEWIALRWALERGVTARLADLPAWDKAFAGVENRYRDRYERYDKIVDALCRRTGSADLDAMWDHLFEGREPAELEPALEAYFTEVRGNDAADERDAPREVVMRAWASWALGVAGDEGDVVFVCGGWHAPALRDVSPGSSEPSVAPAAFGGESHVVPWSNERLDSFAGYEAGMPSPAWWSAQWKLGPRDGAQHMFERTLSAMRTQSSLVKPTVADHIAARTQIHGLAAMRGHDAPQRVDVLDGMLAAFIREAMSGPPPWSRRGLVENALHPALAIMLRTFTGNDRGKLAADTPRPALLRDVHAVLAEHDLVPPKHPVVRSLDWRLPEQRPALRVLHRMRWLAIPGFERVSGPARGTDAKMAEAWRLHWRTDFEPAVIEASRWGSTLESAVTMALTHRLRSASELDERVEILHAAAFLGLQKLAAEIVTLVANSIAASATLGPLAGAMRGLLALWRHGEWLDMVGAPMLTPVLQSAAERTLTLLATIQGDELIPADLDAVIALRDVLRHAAGLGIDVNASCHALLRRRIDPSAPAMLRGAVLGAVWSLEEFDDLTRPDSATATTTATMKGRQDVSAAVADATRAGSEQRLGEYLGGLFALGREPALRDDALVGAVDTVLAGLDDATFLQCLPAMRFAFSWFPPRERHRIGELLASRWGRSPDHGWLDAVAAPVLAAGIELDLRVDERGRALGVLR